MISIELGRTMQADRERQVAGRQRHRATEDQGRRVRINRRAASR